MRIAVSLPYLVHAGVLLRCAGTELFSFFSYFEFILFICSHTAAVQLVLQCLALEHLSRLLPRRKETMSYVTEFSFGSGLLLT